MTSYLNLDKPIEIQVELTTKCNAMCPMCARVDENRAKGQYLNPYMPFEADMKFETWEKMFDKWSLSKVYRIDHTPVFGDPLASSIFLDTVEWIAKKNPKIIVSANTNASLRTPNYWKDLGKLMSFNEENYIAFSIDGLEDTNHLYRRMTKWDKIIENAQAFIDAGGKAHWKMIKFEHNKHQIDQARDLAKKMKFATFTVSPNNGGRELEPNDSLKTFQVPSKFKDTEYNSSHSITHDWQTQKKNMLEKFNAKKVNCEWSNLKNAVFFATNGDIFPCCYTYQRVYMTKRSEANDFIFKTYKKYGREFINVNTHSLQQILKNEWYGKNLVDSFGQTLQDENNPKLHRCAQKCGQSLESRPDLKFAHQNF
tara:strand:+ start:1475 stop:2578 length:1104 start_codon:yes stop_codon:yes gene_type:complete